MATVETFKVIGRPGEENTSQAEVDRFSLFKRLRNGLVVLIVGWLLAAIVSPIPVLHLVLLPAFFFGAIAFAGWQVLKKGVFLKSTFRCPQCGTEFSIAGEPLSLPRYHHCAGCKQQLYIDLAHGSH